MRRAFFFVLAFLWGPLCWTVSSQTAASVAAPQQGSYTSYYVCNGDALQVVNGDPDGANYAEWQGWLYPNSVRLPRSGTPFAQAPFFEVAAEKAAQRRSISCLPECGQAGFSQG